MKRILFASVAAVSLIGLPLQAENWPPVVNPEPGTTNTSTSDSNSTATGVGVGVGVGTGVGVGHGGGGGAGGVGHGGNATGGAGGNATSTGGNSTSDSSSTSTGGNATSHGGSATSGGNVVRGGNVNVNSSTRIRNSAAQAAPVFMPGYGPQNCFGDTNPSGSFGASMQTFGWGVSANSQKASNVCAIVSILGPEAGITYLSQMDRNAWEALRAAGVPTASEKRAQRAAQPVAKVPTCPAGSTWDGKGCWMPAKKKR